LSSLEQQERAPHLRTGRRRALTRVARAHGARRQKKRVGRKKNGHRTGRRTCCEQETLGPGTAGPLRRGNDIRGSLSHRNNENADLRTRAARKVRAKSALWKTQDALPLRDPSDGLENRIEAGGFGAAIGWDSMPWDVPALTRPRASRVVAGDANSVRWREEGAVLMLTWRGADGQGWLGGARGNWLGQVTSICRSILREDRDGDRARRYRATRIGRRCVVPWR